MIYRLLAWLAVRCFICAAVVFGFLSLTPVAILILILAAAFLGGCATTPEVRPALRVEIPGALLTCKPVPPTPAKPGNGGRDPKIVAGFILDLGEAGADCRTKLGAVKRIIEAQP